MRPELAGLTIADRPERWSDLGFTVARERLVVGPIEISLGAAGEGITGWTLRGVAGSDIDGGRLDGLPTAVTAAPVPDAVEHPNRALGIDHVVVVTPDFHRTAEALERTAMPLRRVRESGGTRQGFRRLGPAILELVEAPDAAAVAFWGLVIVVPDLHAPGERLVAHLGDVRDAVQPGRHIATLAREAGLSTRIAFMDPPPSEPIDNAASARAADA